MSTIQYTVEIDIECLVDETDTDYILEWIDVSDVVMYYDHADLLCEISNDTIFYHVDDSDMVSHLEYADYYVVDEDRIEEALEEIPDETIRAYLKQKENFLTDLDVLKAIEGVLDEGVSEDGTNHNKVKAIKMYREHSGFGLKQSKEIVEKYLKGAGWQVEKKEEKEDTGEETQSYTAHLTYGDLHMELFSEDVMYFTEFQNTNGDGTERKSAAGIGKTRIEFEVPIVHSITTIVKALKATPIEQVKNLIASLNEYVRLCDLASHEDAITNIVNDIVEGT